MRSLGCALVQYDIKFIKEGNLDETGLQKEDYVETQREKMPMWQK